MNLIEALDILTRLNQLKSVGSNYSKVSKLLSSEATTYNLEQARELLINITKVKS